MTNYLMRYKGKYRLKANIDKNTNDFPRDDKGNLDTDDIYIDCSQGNQIYHYGHQTFVAYIPSIGRGRNIIKSIFLEIANGEIGVYTSKTGVSKDGTPIYRTDWKSLYKDVKLAKYISDIAETDSEIEFRFHAKNIDLIAPYLKPKTSGADISPFSPRNLPKAKHEISAEEMRAYKEITDKIPKEDKLVISRYTTSFFNDILEKDKLYKSVNFKNDMKKNMLRGKEYIHFIGEWKRYLQYLKERIENEEKF